MSNVSYPYDDSGHAATNLIKGEIQVLTLGNNTPYRYFIPTFAPFYETNFKLFGRDALGNERELVRNVDYNFNLTFIGATRGNGAAVWGGVNIINQTIQGPVKLNYQCLGGKYSADRDFVVRTIAENNYNPRVVAWDQVTSIQEMFPPSRHPQDLDTFTGYRDLIDAVQGYQDHPSEFQTLKDLIWNHMLDVNDPHETINLLTEYAKKSELESNVNDLNDRIDIEHRLIERNISDIADLKNGIDSGGANYQSQIDANRERITNLETSLNTQINDVNGKINDIRRDITSLDTSIRNNTNEINRNKSDISDLRDLINVNKAAADKGIADNTTLINNLSNRVNKMDTDINRRIDDLSAAIQDANGEVTVLDEEPYGMDDFLTNILIVKKPHFRYFIWVETDEEGNGEYQRAPWHRPGMLMYSYHNPTSIMGYLPVRGDINYNKADYPDLCKELGIEGEGTFTLVEMRGEFLRVLDNGRGIDVGRANLSWVRDSLQIHNHFLPTSTGEDGDGWAIVDPSVPNSPWVQSIVNSVPENNKPSAVTYPVPVDVEDGNDYPGNIGYFDKETKPRSIAVPLWISY